MISRFTSVLKIAIVSALFIGAAQTSKAQMVREVEPFDNTFAGITWPSNELPFGWVTGKGAGSLDANNAWDRSTVPSVNPNTVTTQSAPAMLRFRSGYITLPGEVGYISSRPYDMTTRPAGTPSVVRFWLFREGTGGTDNIQVYANNGPDPFIGTPALLVDTLWGSSTIPRNCAALPPQNTCGTWQLWGFTIPATTWSIQNLYITIKVTHTTGAGSANVYIDDFSIDTYPGAQVLNAISLAYQNTQSVTLNAPNNWIIGVNVNMFKEVPNACPIGAFTFSHTGTSSPGTDVLNSGTGGVKLWWTGGTPSFPVSATNIPMNAVFCGSYAGANFPVATFTITPNAAAIAAMGGGLHNGNNYFWLTYDATGVTAGNQLDADFISVNTGVGCATVTPCGGSGCALAGSRPIDGFYCVPSYTAGTSWLNGSYTNNDYVRQFKVTCTTPALDPTFNTTPMFNDHNDVGPPFSCGNDGCISVANGYSTFRAHPPDYEKFAPALNFPEMGACTNNATFPAGNCNRTASFLRDATNPTYRIDVQCGTWGGSNYIAAFIDFNHDFDFADAGEKIFQSGNMAALAFANGTFTIPVGTYYGPTTMRVREWYAQPNIDACSPGYYGEVEDYTVILRPGCSPLYPGWKIWLGYTDDWNVNSNWCGGVPTINDNALIPGKGAAAFNRGAATYHPVIKSGVLATTRKLVMLNDTVEINAPVPGSLRISDSLSIGVASLLNTSALIVDSNYRDTAQISNGVTTSGVNVLFRGGQREKSQLMYKAAELSAKGLINGDLIDSIFIPIRQRTSVVPYLNFQISYYYAQNGVAPNFFSVNTGYSATANQVMTAPITGAPGYGSGVVYTNPSMNLGGAPWSIPFNGSGYLKIGLTTPIQVNLTGAPLIITICWEQGGATTPSADQTFQTQTVGYKSYMQIYQLGTTVPPAPVGCAMVDTAGKAWSTAQGGGFQTVGSDFRPNLTFKYKRVYTKFPIFMESNATAPVSTGHWMNFGNFISANSIVTFMGNNGMIQRVAGTNPTTYNELRINHTGVGYTRQEQPITVNDTLYLTAGRLLLNSLTTTLNSNSLGALTRTSGFLQSESLPPNYGLINWKMGSTLGAHLFPFVTAGGTYIPFTYNATGGTSDLTLGTYYPSTNPPQLLPWPTGVTTINSHNNPLVSNETNMVKRFWVQTQTGAAPTADITFTWSIAAPSEAPTSGAGTTQSQRWQGAPITWDWPTAGQTNPTAQSNWSPGISVFNTPWVLTLQTQPLPVSLLNFTAKGEKNRVKLEWTTASETNNDKFTVERTTDASEFIFIDELQSKGPSTSTLNYMTYDNNPKIGLQYYRLKQTDLNGGEALSKLVPVTFGKDAAFEIVTTINNEDGSFDVVFNYNSDLPYSYKIIDMLGNVVAVKTDLKAVNGSNVINVKVNLASGVYSIMIQNQDETISRKIFRQ